MTQSKVRKICSEYCKNIKVKIIFDTCKLSSFFSAKDSLPVSYLSNLVYKFTCGGCEATYIGETAKCFQVRANEHLHTDKNSAVYKHLRSHPHCRQQCSVDNFEVLVSAKFYSDRKVKEAILIKQQNPIFNKQLRHQNVSIIV